MQNVLLALAFLVSADFFFLRNSSCCRHIVHISQTDFLSVMSLYAESLASVSIRAVQVALFSFR